jgi:pimeloyl-ACP methyl ester carboxylesterase
MPLIIGWHFYSCAMLHHQISGNTKDTIVLVHGFCENHTCFNYIVSLLSSKFKIICPDLPGFGKSKLLENTSMDEMADCLKELLDNLSISKCVMLGHSKGGYVSLAFANKYPEFLSAIGLLHSTALADSAERLEKRKQIIKFIEERKRGLYR